MKKYLLILGLLISGLLFAGQYTLQDMIDAGLNNSYSIRQQQIMVKNSDLSARAAAWNLLPSADIAASRSNFNGNYSNSGSLEFSRSLSLTDPAYFSYRQVKLDQAISHLDWQQAQKQLVYNIYSDWLDLAQLQKEISIQQTNLSVLQKIQQQTELQEQLGQRTIYDVNQSEINTINAELTVDNLTNQLSEKRAALFNLVKLDDDGSDLVFTETDPASLNIDFGDTGFETIAIKQLQDNIRKTKLSKLQQKLGLLPSLYLSGSYNQHSVSNDILDFDKYEDSYALSAGFSWSLWTPWTKGSSYAQALNSLTLNQWNLEEEQTGLRLNRENFQREWNYLTRTLSLTTKKYNQAQDNLRIAQEKYNLGTLSLIELEQTRVDALDAELEVNNITYQLQKKIQEWNLLNSLPVLDKY